MKRTIVLDVTPKNWSPALSFMQADSMFCEALCKATDLIRTMVPIERVGFVESPAIAANYNGDGISSNLPVVLIWVELGYVQESIMQRGVMAENYRVELERALIRAELAESMPNTPPRT